MEYSNDNRGKIQIRDRARQIIDFSGLRYGNITPTDLDGVIEYNRKGAYVLYEFKYTGGEMPLGQQRALEEMINDFQKAGKEAVLLVCEHDIEDCEQDVPAAETPVKRIFYRGKWFHYGSKRVYSAKECTDEFFRKISCK